MLELKLVPCFFCRNEKIEWVRHHNLRCTKCGMTGPDEDIYGKDWNKLQTLLWKDEGIDPSEF